MAVAAAASGRGWGFEVAVGCGARSSDVGEEELLSETGRVGEVRGPDGFLELAGLFPAQPASPQFTDDAASTAVVAVAFDVVGVPPPAVPASPPVLAGDAPGEATLTRPGVAGSGGVAGVAEPVVEVALGSAT